MDLQVLRQHAVTQKLQGTALARPVAHSVQNQLQAKTRKVNYQTSQNINQKWHIMWSCQHRQPVANEAEDRASEAAFDFEECHPVLRPIILNATKAERHLSTFLAEEILELDCRQNIDRHLRGEGT